jgi:hypothetical protein
MEFDAFSVVYNNMPNSNKKMCIKGRRSREGDKGGEYDNKREWVEGWVHKK